MADKPVEKKDGSLVDTLHIQGRVLESYVPEGFDSIEEFLADMRQEYEADVEFDRTNRDQALDDKKFAAGEQWDPQVLEQRKGLPCLVLNNIPQFTAQLVGDWRESRKAIKVVPSNNEDVEIASVRGDLIRNIELQSRADRVYDSSFESLVQCGDGAFRISVEYARSSIFDQDLYIRPIEDALSVVWDRFAVDPTGRDARRVFVTDRIPIKEFKNKWPDKTPDALSDSTIMGSLTATGWVDSDAYRVTEYWRLVERQRLMALFENGKILEIDDTNMEQYLQEHGQPVKVRTVWVSYAQMHLVTGFSVLSGPYEYRLNRVPIVRMSGRVVNVDGRRIRYGLVRFMKDAVRLKNFNRSIAAEQLGYAPKAQWMATEAAVEGRESKLRKAHLSRDPLLIFNDEAEFGRNVIRMDPPVTQTAYETAAQINAQDMKDITGIHDASLGMRSNEVSGRAIMARQREGDIASLTFHDNGNAAVLEGGDILNQLIPQVYDGTRIIRIIGEDEVMKFQKINDPMDPNSIDFSVGSFDVALSTGTSYTTRRVEAAQAMMDSIQVWPQLMTVAGDLVAKAQDWPGADKLAERLKKTIPPQFLDEGEEGGLGITPEQLQEMQMQLSVLAQENQAMKADKDINYKRLEVERYNAETQRIRALSDHEVDGTKMEQDAIQSILNASAKLDEQDMRREEFDRKESADQTKQADEFALRREQMRLRMTSTPGGTSTSSTSTQSQ